MNSSSKLTYEQFVEQKIIVTPQGGINIDYDSIHPILKPHQKDMVFWCVKGGQRGGFASFGLGKSLTQLEINRQFHLNLGGITLIVAPLGVIQEFKRDAKMIDLEVQYIKTTANIEQYQTAFFITNYERVLNGDVNVNLFTSICLDEAAVLRSYGSETYQTFLPLFQQVKYKFVFTATPAPNRLKELIHYSAFLGIMDSGQSLTRFFSRNSTQANELTLYPHKVEEFWLWAHTWGLFLQKPSDLGHDDTGYALPNLKIVEHCISVPKEGFKTDSWGNVEMFDKQAVGLSEGSKEKRESIAARMQKALEIIGQSDDKTHWILWHHLERERLAIEAMLPEAKTVYGTQDLELRENLILDFSDGKYRILATKPEIAGSGCNFQRHCHKAIFLGIDYKFHDIIQAVMRIYRFLQTEEVEVHFIFTENEQNIWKSCLKKWAQHNETAENMSKLIQEFGLSDTGIDRLKRGLGVKRIEAKGKNYVIACNDCVDEAKLTSTNSQHLIVTSIPFANHYEYSPNYNDFGHTNDNEHFWAQMDYLTPELMRILEPGRVAAIHVKDRINFGNVTGYGYPTVQPFHCEAITHYIKHGFRYSGMITVTTDVVRENNQTYRLGWTEQCKDGTKMGCGSPEYILLFRKPQTDTSKGYADNPVTKDKENYTRKQWQIDAHSLWRSSGNRLFTPDELATMDMTAIQKWWKEYRNNNVYDYNTHVQLGSELENNGRLPATFMLFDPAVNTEWVWSDILRMRTLNTEQSKRNVENHICPLQLDIVERLIERFTNEGEGVYDPFGGIMTVPVCALKMKRKARASELNPDYFRDGKQYCYEVEYKNNIPTLFDVLETEIFEPEKELAV